jgi:hypothetical protein
MLFELKPLTPPRADPATIPTMPRGKGTEH